LSKDATEMRPTKQQPEEQTKTNSIVVRILCLRLK